MRDIRTCVSMTADHARNAAGPAANQRETAAGEQPEQLFTIPHSQLQKMSPCDQISGTKNGGGDNGMATIPGEIGRASCRERVKGWGGGGAGREGGEREGHGRM